MNRSNQRIRTRWPSLAGILLGTLALSSSRPIANSGVTLSLDKSAYIPGEPATVTVKGLPNTLTFIGGDTDPGPTMFTFGSVSLGFSAAYQYHVGMTDPNGCLIYSCGLNCDNPLLGQLLYLQAVQFPMGGTPCVSNVVTATWSDPGGVCAPINLCPGQGVKPALLMMTYTGDDCSATSHHQDPTLVTCSGDPADAAMVHVIARDSSGKYVWFEGDVALGASFDVDAAEAGRTQLQGETVIELYDVMSGQLLQVVSFHTSCSQPLVAGDQFGGVRLDGLVPAPK